MRAVTFFAFGAVLNEMATGEAAILRGRAKSRLASSILESDPAPISAAKPHTPFGLRACGDDLPAKNPEECFQTAHDIRLELLVDCGGAANYNSRRPLLRRFGGPWLAWGAAAVFAVAAIAFAMAYFQSPRASQVCGSLLRPPSGESRFPAERKRRRTAGALAGMGCASALWLRRTQTASKCFGSGH